MHAVAQFLAEIVAPVQTTSSLLATGFSCVTRSPFGIFAIAAAVVTSLVVAAGCGCWAFLERSRAGSQLNRFARALRQLQSERHFSNALINAQAELVVVLPTRNRKLSDFQGGRVVLKHCLAGPGGGRLAMAIDQLLTHGRPFAVDVQTIGLRDVAVRGRIVSDSAVVFLQPRRETIEVPSKPVQMATRCRIASPDLASVTPANGPRKAQTTSCRGVVVIGADGCLERYNRIFANYWSLTEDELRGRPLLSEVAGLCGERMGLDAIWEIVTSAVTSPEPEHHGDWGVYACADGRRVSLSFSRLRDGGTLVVFDERTEQTLEVSA
jgi:hypothetical protein